MNVSINRNLGSANLDVMNFLNEVSARYPSALSFAAGRPYEGDFAVETTVSALRRYADSLADKTGKRVEDILNSLGQYQPTNGIIRDEISRYLRRDENIDVCPEAILITNGCQEAMTIVMAGLFDAQTDVLMVPDPTYVGLPGIASVLGIEVCPVPWNETHIDFGVLDDCVQAIHHKGKNAKALYVIPDFNNPLGCQTSLADRHSLLRWAQAQSLLLIEDNPYGMFSFDGERLPTMKALDTDRQVVYLGSFSKTLFPGLRLGFMIADQAVSAGTSAPCFLAEELSKVKSLTSVTTSPIAQGIVAGVLLENDFTLTSVMEKKVERCRRNRDAMLNVLDHYFGPGGVTPIAVAWQRPAGGFFLSATLPFTYLADDVKKSAEQYQFICCPMSFFSMSPGNEHRMRLAFSYLSENDIAIGIGRLHDYIVDRLHGGAITRRSECISV